MFFRHTAVGENQVGEILLGAEIGQKNRLFLGQPIGHIEGQGGLPGSSPHIGHGIGLEIGSRAAQIILHDDLAVQGHQAFDFFRHFFSVNRL